MEEYIGHALTIIGLVVAGGIAWGVLKTQVSAHGAQLKDQEPRLRAVELAKTAWEAHVAEAPNVLNRLGNIEKSISSIQTELSHRGDADQRIQDALEANRMVISELSDRISLMQGAMNANQGRE